ncbi:MAG: zf-HC2 domain-containing protein [Actinomycetota bacterium]|nr:zf-HC2 domain-containing protein [Actinomycetota bacterium]MDQ2788362.1 zf-HC2 domain-containing protein [Actinomycetota bacterium]
MAVHDVTCREVVELLTDFLEGSLPVDRQDLLERHLAMCTWCETYLDQLRHNLTVLGQLREDDVPAAMVDSLAHAFRAGISQRRHDDPSEPSGT